ncbi:MAG TPA: hypothetical protein VEY71_08485 [Chitinophagales bacterium]|nr:hypothetical protein [Chitinophagales bacterium]
MKAFTAVSVFICAHVTAALAQPAGSLDPSFGNGGKVITSLATGADRATDVVLQSDGKLLVSGFSTSPITGKDFIVLRYNTDGSLDTAFGTGGYTTTDVQLGSDDEAFALALQTDGKIVLAGFSDDGSNRNAALVRYNADGTVDTDFGTNGRVTVDFNPTQQDEAHALKIHLLTGKIVIGGFSASSSSLSSPALARLHPDGTLDSTFNSTGIAILPNQFNQYVYAIEDLAVLPNGKITAIGWRDFPGLSWDSDYWVARVNADGTLDNTFSGDGLNTFNGSFNGHDRAYAMLLQSDNSIVAAGGGHITTLAYDATLLNISADGTSGSVAGSMDYGTLSDDVAYALAQDVNGKFVMAGSTGSSSSRSFAVMRLNANGTADNTFDTDGKLTTTFGNAMNEAFGVAVQADNKIIAVGYTGNDIAIARYLGDAAAQLDAFSLTSPANNALNQNYTTLTLNWTDAFGATSYEVEVDSSQTFTANPVTYTVSTSSKVLSALQPNTTYYWRVRASDGSNWGAWSPMWSFTTALPVGIEMVEPSNVYVYPNPVLSRLVIVSDAAAIGVEYDVVDPVGRVLASGFVTELQTEVDIVNASLGLVLVRVGDRLFKVVKL